jgi:hypothetical protein
MRSAIRTREEHTPKRKERNAATPWPSVKWEQKPLDASTSSDAAQAPAPASGPINFSHAHIDQMNHLRVCK